MVKKKEMEKTRKLAHSRYNSPTLVFVFWSDKQHYTLKLGKVFIVRVWIYCKNENVFCFNRNKISCL